MIITRSRTRGAFSLIELVIVVVIIGIIAAIAIPRMSRGAAGAADSALTANLKLLRNAIDMYYTEHGAYPTVAGFVNQMTQYSNPAGDTFSATKTTTCYLGPYLRSIPPLPVGAKKGSSGVAAADGANVGWIYTVASGSIAANCPDSEVDDRGVKYNSY